MVSCWSTSFMFFQTYHSTPDSWHLYHHRQLAQAVLSQPSSFWPPYHLWTAGWVDVVATVWSVVALETADGVATSSWYCVFVIVEVTVLGPPPKTCWISF